MSNLQRILQEATSDLMPGQRIPVQRWESIAKQCNHKEILELNERVLALQKELETVEPWDGDTQDDIHYAINMFKQIMMRASWKYFET